VGTIYALWALQDERALAPAEATAISLKREHVAGKQHLVWNPALLVPPKEFNMSEVELARVRAAIDTRAGFGVAASRGRLEPLLTPMFKSEPRS